MGAIAINEVENITNTDNNKNIRYLHLNNLHRVEKGDKMKYNLQILSNGLLVCGIKVFNLSDDKEEVVCKALIDTGAEYSYICKSVYGAFTTKDEWAIKTTVSTLHDNRESLTYPFGIFLPEKNLSFLTLQLGIMDLSMRKEYKAIIGMDLLKNFDLVYKGFQGEAWLEG